MQKSEQINELAAALAKAQGAFSAAEREHVAKVTSKKGEGSSYSYAYADLAAYLDVCRGPLAENGLAFIQSIKVEGARVTVTTTLLHSSGQWYEFDPLTMEAADMMPQSIGSIITYARRYSLGSLGLASEADDDANSGQGNNAESGRKENNLPACPKCGTNKSVIVGKPEYGGGFVCYGKKGGCGEKWHEEPAAEPPAVDDSKPKSKAKEKSDAARNAAPGLKPADDLPLTEGEKIKCADCLDDLAKAQSLEASTALWAAGPADWRKAMQDYVRPHFTARKGDFLKEQAA